MYNVYIFIVSSLLFQIYEMIVSRNLPGAEPETLNFLLNLIKDLLDESGFNRRDDEEDRGKAFKDHLGLNKI